MIITSGTLLPLILVAQLSLSLSALPVYTGIPPPFEVGAELHDHGGLFGGHSERRARRELETILRDCCVKVLIETVGPLDGEGFGGAASGRPPD